MPFKGIICAINTQSDLQRTVMMIDRDGVVFEDHFRKQDVKYGSIGLGRRYKRLRGC